MRHLPQPGSAGPEREHSTLYKQEEVGKGAGHQRGSWWGCASSDLRPLPEPAFWTLVSWTEETPFLGGLEQDWWAGRETWRGLFFLFNFQGSGQAPN